MSGRQSSATEKALRLVSKGMEPGDAAAKSGVDLSTVYRALKRKGTPAREVQKSRRGEVQRQPNSAPKLANGKASAEPVPIIQEQS